MAWLLTRALVVSPCETVRPEPFSYKTAMIPSVSCLLLILKRLSSPPVSDETVNFQCGMAAYKTVTVMPNRSLFGIPISAPLTLFWT